MRGFTSATVREGHMRRHRLVYVEGVLHWKKDVEEFSLGRVGFDAYGDAAGPHGPWKTFDGRDIPQWESLQSGRNDDGTPNAGGPLTMERWEAAANAIADEQHRRNFKRYQPLDEACIREVERIAERPMALMRTVAEEVLVAELGEARGKEVMAAISKCWDGYAFWQSYAPSMVRVVYQAAVNGVHPQRRAAEQQMLAEAVVPRHG